ncbi:S41 family peptidase [Pseudoalteromonas sp. JBTF-M23]|uniref:S41 family peptidase n=1 Tax=Pseudoalteromonas caenipelagi TaxID=2726988 RepID=A0A849VAZ7_9GAMM|nr:S41 family peptidase [Pseudoalteromonas caenipelagi]NOU50028.1 S41 family peptidase [Pseudoalteromonas caenipelagi]
MKTIRLFLSTMLCVWCLILLPECKVYAQGQTDLLQEREQIAAIEKIAELISLNYVLPDMGLKVESALYDAQKQGQFAHINSKKQFINEVGKFLRAYSKDGHLGLTPMPIDKNVTHILTEKKENRINNFALEQAKVLPGNIGYFKINKFHPDERAKKLASYALNFLSHTSHLVIDLRDSTGGSMELVTHLVSHFVQADRHLWDMYDKEGLSYRVASVEVSSEPYLQKIPITILTAKGSISAAEFFTYTLKHLGRARIVGEQTEGLAHATGARKVNEWLILRLPLMRPISPITKTNWERVGVKPDVEMAEEGALDWVLNNL